MHAKLYYMMANVPHVYFCFGVASAGVAFELDTHSITHDAECKPTNISACCMNSWSLHSRCKCKTNTCMNSMESKLVDARYASDNYKTLCDYLKKSSVSWTIDPNPTSLISQCAKKPQHASTQNTAERHGLSDALFRCVNSKSCST